MRWIAVALVGVGLSASGCVKSTTTRLSQDTFQLDASGAPICGRTGTISYANKLAAAETIRLGYDKFMIGGVSAQNNVGVFNSGSRTTGTMTTYGSNTAFSANTVNRPMIYGSNDASLIVRMFRTGEPGSEQALDARSALGPDWQTIVSEGLSPTCT